MRIDAAQIAAAANALMVEANQSIKPENKHIPCTVHSIEKVEHIFGLGETVGYVKYVVEFYKISNNEEHLLEFVEHRLGQHFGIEFEVVGCE